MNKYERVNGWEFEYDEDNEQYECRGDVFYDNEHDPMPDPDLWRAAIQLADDLKKRGIKAMANHSEKGWVEVEIRDTN